VEESLKQVEVMTEKARVKTTFSDIVKVTNGEVVDSTLREGRRIEFPKTQPLSQRKDQEPLSQLNVIGLTVEDALPRVDKFIDQALLHGLEKVHIVHGVGSGRLGNAIGKYLQGHPGVRSFARGEGMKGGRGITVVELR
jgi:dsDNA-specific endonuclease/ATPase MutS2